MEVSKGDSGAAEHIDIYEDLKTEEAGDPLEAEADALYDDVLTGSVDSESTLGKQECKEDGKSAQECGGGKRFSVYIGNFNWWTSDSDLIAMVRKQGVKDIVEVKFAENRINGQSKGYAELVVSTEESLNRLLETMPQCKINGEKVECRYVSRRSLAEFEALARKRDIRMAIETLYTATAVIKQSRVFYDKRCRMLVESLNDCLNSVETKCFPSRIQVQITGLCEGRFRI
ncbi:hypothetical protein QTP86_017483 [Hemibagrus guttatus]|nr:hypothetical protein QTP86_017483 [Hemibagrus guttatus]